MRKWPGRSEVLESFRRWACALIQGRQDIVRIGCFGSLVNGTWGVGSDIDIVIILRDSTLPPLERAAQWDTTALPVPADVVVLTRQESREIASRRFRSVIENEVVWVEQRRKETGVQ